MFASTVYGWRHLVKATEVTAGLAESNGSLPPDRWLRVTCGLTVHWDQLRAQRSVTGNLYFYLYIAFFCTELDAVCCPNQFSLVQFR